MPLKDPVAAAAYAAKYRATHREEIAAYNASATHKEQRSAYNADNQVRFNQLRRRRRAAAEGDDTIPWPGIVPTRRMRLIAQEQKSSLSSDAGSVA